MPHVPYPLMVISKRPKNEKDFETQSYNEAAIKCVAYINQQTEKSESDTIQFTYDTIATELGLEKQLVLDILSKYDAGHNGITITKERNET